MTAECNGLLSVSRDSECFRPGRQAMQCPLNRWRWCPRPDSRPASKQCDFLLTRKKVCDGGGPHGGGQEATRRGLLGCRPQTQSLVVCRRGKRPRSGVSSAARRGSPQSVSNMTPFEIGNPTPRLSTVLDQTWARDGNLACSFDLEHAGEGSWGLRARQL